VILAVLMRFNHIASVIVNGDEYRMRAGVRLRLIHSGGSTYVPATTPESFNSIF
jgi:hypothetical protein